MSSRPPTVVYHHYQDDPEIKAAIASYDVQRFAKYKERNTRKAMTDKYEILGFISAGTYGRVFKARKLYSNPNPVTGFIQEYAIKKFKPEKEGEAAFSTGISQSACREIALCRELRHENIVHLEEVLLEPADRSIAMVFEYAEHDLLQIIHHHGHVERKPIPEYSVKSILWQLLNGLSYLHNNWVLHRDLKPANILVTSDGVVKIADLGLARLFQAPLQTLFHGDKVIVTIWYRAPELLLGTRHYTKVIDIWAVGCIFAELLMLKPIFKGEEAKVDNKKTIPFQRDQLSKIFDIMGTPTKERWPSLDYMPEYQSLKDFPHRPTCELRNVYMQASQSKSERGLDLLMNMLDYDPEKRISADTALVDSYFSEEPRPGLNSFVSPSTDRRMFDYPLRKVAPV